MSTIRTGLTSLEKFWLCCNYDQSKLDALYNNVPLENIDKTFKMHSNKSDSTDLNDVFFEVIISKYADARFGTSGWGYYKAKYKLSQSQISAISPDDIDEIVLCYNFAGTDVSIEINRFFDDVSAKNYYSIVNVGNTIGNFNVMYRDKDGDIHSQIEGNTIEIVNISFSNGKNAAGDYVDGYPRDYDGSMVNYVFPWINGNNNSKGAVAGLYGNYEQITSFSCSHKAYATPEKALAYLRDGIDDPIEDDGEEETPAEDRIKTLFYNSTVYSRLYNDSVVNRVGPSSINIDIQYKTNAGETLVNPNRAICGYVNTDNEPNNNTYFGNIHWLVKQGVKIIESNTNRISGASKTYPGSMPSWAESTGFQGPYVDGNTIYESKYNTNMYIFANRTDAEAYLAGLDPKPIGGGSNSGSFNPDEFVGDPTEYNVGHDLKGGGMSSCWIMNESGLEDLASLFATGLTKVESASGDIILNITKTAARSFASHAEPIDAVVDLFWIPVDPSDFYTQGASYFEIGKDDLSSASSVIKLTAQSGDTFIGIGQKVDQAGNNILNNSFNLIGNKIQGISDNTNVTITERSTQ